MLQRLQTLFLFGISLICVLLIAFSLNIAFFKHSAGSEMQLGFWKNTLPNGTDMVYTPKWINLILLVAIGLTSFATIFLFKDRKLQMKLCLYLAIGSLALYFLLWLDYSSLSIQNNLSTPRIGFHVIWPGVITALSLLSWWGVRKDEKLVSDMDRLR